MPPTPKYIPSSRRYQVVTRIGQVTTIEVIPDPWESMSTAPKDGTPILVYGSKIAMLSGGCSESPVFGVVQWRAGDHPEIGKNIQEGWFGVNEVFYETLWNPLCWMPIVEVPEHFLLESMKTEPQKQE